MFNRKIHQLVPYKISKRFENKDKDDWIFLDWNESTFELPEEIKKSLIDSIKNNIGVSYPDGDDFKLQDELSKFAGVKNENVLVFNGSDSALRNCFECLISDGKKVNVIEPEYNQINTFVHMSGGEIQSILLDDPFDLNVKELTNHLNKGDILYTSNPSNPTGRLLSRNEVLQLLDAEIVLCLDEAYIEFVNLSSSELVQEYKNLFVFRTFSKAFGLAGARLGYILSHSENIKLLAKNRNSKDINAYSQIAVLEALKNIDIFYERINIVIKERNSFIDFINNLDSDITARNTNANFVLLTSPRINEILDYLLKDKILIRDRQGMHKMELTARVTIGTPNQMERLKKSISEFFK